MQYRQNGRVVALEEARREQEELAEKAADVIAELRAVRQENQVIRPGDAAWFSIPYFVIVNQGPAEARNITMRARPVDPAVNAPDLRYVDPTLPIANLHARQEWQLQGRLEPDGFSIEPPYDVSLEWQDDRGLQKRDLRLTMTMIYDARHGSARRLVDAEHVAAVGRNRLDTLQFL
jgi:hypothetical protein